MIKKRVFAVLSVIFVLALSVVPASANSPDYVISDQIVKPPVPVYVTYDVLSPYDNSRYEVVYDLIPYIPLDSTYTFNNSSQQTYPYIDFSLPSGSKGTFSHKFQFTNIVNEYNSFDNAGTIRFNVAMNRLQYVLNPFSSDPYNLSLISMSFSASDFYCFSHEEFGLVDSDQNSQILFYFSQFTYNANYDLDSSVVTFTYAPVDEHGLSSAETFTSSFSDFAYLEEGIYYVDIGSIFKTDRDQPLELFYVLDFSITFFPKVGNNTFTLQSNSSNTYYFPHTQGPGVSFVYSPEFADVYTLLPEHPMTLSDYTDWITTAVSGFFEIQIFPGFYLSGFLMVVIAFACVIWFLKIFAGG